MSIVVIGSTFMDIKGYPLSQFISAGRNVGRVVTVHGGVCRNIAEDIANVELRPTFVSVVDQSGLGQDVIDKLKRHKVDTRYIRKVENGLGTWLAIFDNAGDVVASISKRPDLSGILTILQEDGDAIFEKADSIAVEIDMDGPILREVFRLARQYQKKVYAVVSNISIAVERRDLIMRTACFVCNQQEAGIFFSDDYDRFTPEDMQRMLAQRVPSAHIEKMVVTMGGQGAVWADIEGNSGICPPISVDVLDTTGAGDSFFAGVALGLTYGKTLAQACDIGARLAASVIVTKENVCPRFRPAEFGIVFRETPQ